MRSKAIVIALALFLVGAFTVASADEAVLIDFSSSRPISSRIPSIRVSSWITGRP